jgi:hypothetical protein
MARPSLARNGTNAALHLRQHSASRQPPTSTHERGGEAVPPPRPIPATGSDSNVPLQLGVLLILSGLIAMVAGHRRAGDERS